MTPIHLLEADTTATGHSRLSCMTCVRSVVRQPYMSDVHWKMAQEKFALDHPVPDETEALRRVEVEEINRDPGSREALEAKYGKVWDIDEMVADFEALGFLAPYVHVRRRADGVEGSLMFQGSPRFYFGFVPR